MAVRATSSGIFLDTLGINERYVTTEFTNRLVYTGVRVLRRDFGDVAEVNSVIPLLTATRIPGVHPGVKVDYLTRISAAAAAVTIQDRIDIANTLAAASVLRSVEGPNEPNNAGSDSTYLGFVGGGTATWKPFALFMRDYYAAVRSQVLLNNIPVLGISEAGAQGIHTPSENWGLQFASVAGGRADQSLLATHGIPAATRYSDWINPHNYVTGSPAVGPVANSAWNAASQDVHVSGWDDLSNNHGPVLWGGPGFHAGYSTVELPTIPHATTETGWSTSGQAHSISEDAQGKILLNVYLSQFVRGNFQFTCFYELVDGHGSPGIGYGIYSSSTTPKLAATYLHNFTTILADPFYDAAPGYLDLQICNAPSTCHSLLLQDSRGPMKLIVWNERIPNGGGSDTVTIDFGKKIPRVNIYDPTLSEKPIDAMTFGQTINYSMTDRPIIFELKNSSKRGRNRGARW